MINPLENLVKEVLANLPGATDSLRQDMQHSLQAGLELGLKKLDRLREQLKVLEAKINDLEKS